MNAESIERRSLYGDSEFLPAATLVSVLIGTALISQYNYLLFHSIAELFSIIVAFTIFVLTWNARGALNNNFLKFAGIGYLFVASLDLVHMLAYKGMGVFADSSANLATQLWISARYLNSLSLLLALLLMRKEIKSAWIFLGHFVVAAGLLATIFIWPVFPACYINGVGLTLFKKSSEYLISSILVITLLLLYWNRGRFAKNIFNRLAFSITTLIGAELAFTFYASVYGFSNLAGHLLKVVSFYYLYRAIVETGIIQPFDLIFRELKQNENDLRQARDELEDRVLLRTADLARVNRALKVLSHCNHSMVRSRSESELLHEICRIIVEDGGYLRAWVGYKTEDESLYSAASWGFTVEPPVRIGLEDGDVEKGMCPLSAAVRKQKPFVLNRPEDGREVTAWLSEGENAGKGALITLPLVIGDQIFGVLVVIAAEEDAFCREETHLMQELAEDMIYGVTTLRTRAEREHAEEALRLSERYYRTLLFSMQEDIFVITPDYRIVDANKPVLTSCGHRFETIVNQKCYNVFHGLDEPCAEAGSGCLLESVFKTGEPASTRREQLKTDGTKIWVNTLLSPLIDENGRTTHVIYTVWDVTAEIALERRLRQTQKMEAVGKLAGGIAHDFNNILGIIYGYAELAVLDIPGSSPAQDSLANIITACERTRSLIRQIQTFGRKTEPQKVTLHLVSAVNESLTLLRAILPATVEIKQETSIPDGIEDTVFADPTQISQILMNLCANASHAMEVKGGILCIGISALNFNSADPDRPSDLAPGEYLRLTVSDTGHGMHSETLERIFEPYFTTRHNQEGTGLGLAVVHGIVKGHDGAVTVQSAIGKGTTFTIYLPRTGAVLPRQEKPDTELPKGDEQILFVDDEEKLVDVTGKRLERLGYRVTGFTDSVEALRIFKKDPKYFDLVITDLTMPKMDGIALARELVAIRPDIPIILCTGYNDKISPKDAWPAGIRELVPKPLVQRETAHIIRRAIDTARKKQDL